MVLGGAPRYARGGPVGKGRAYDGGARGRVSSDDTVTTATETLPGITTVVRAGTTAKTRPAVQHPPQPQLACSCCGAGAPSLAE